jgi:WD40-like Beta Propeller Repeat
MRKALLLAIGLAVLAATPATAKVPGVNGRIVFDDGDGPVYTINPDGSDMVQIAFGHDIARWSSDGSLISMTGDPLPDDRVTTALVSPDGSVFENQVIPDPTLNLECPAWEPGDARLACEVWDDVHPERTPGVFTVRRSDWNDLVRITSNPCGGHDIPGDYSPDGGRIAFARECPADGVAMFVVDVDGSNERRVSPWQEHLNTPRWSPNGRWLLYDNGRGALMLVRPDGTGRHRIPLVVGSRSAAFEPDWAPDGTRIVFSLFTSRAPATGQIGIYTASPRGGAVTPVATTMEGFFNGADWGPATE